MSVNKGKRELIPLSVGNNLIASVILRKIMNYKRFIRWKVFNEVLELGSKVMTYERL
jgi:hypothetical protein